MTAVPPERFDHLDGLRGAAAFYVVLFHAGVCFSVGVLPPWARPLNRLLAFGHEAVAIFIVLSGYCLMLPAARAGGQLAGGTARYLVRRARRILPPYYAALAGTLLLIALIPTLRPAAPTGTIWDDSHPAFAAGPLLSHLFLVHNLSPDWVVRINGPLWSVATEWQIYFFFPLVLLPLWRRAGVAVAVLVAFALGRLPLWLAPALANAAVTWYLGLFALGLAAAAISRADRPLERRLRTAVPWPALTAILFLACAAGGLLFAKRWFRSKPETDALVGLATAALLVYCAQGTSPVRRWLEARPLVALGHFSYSLYLVHLPVVALCFFAVRALSLPPLAHVLALLLVSVPSSLLIAYAFHRLVERRFMQPARAGSIR
jgi:peptidoglycan/LPS O-acetylase OafA/YrhL